MAIPRVKSRVRGRTVKAVEGTATTSVSSPSGDTSEREVVERETFPKDVEPAYVRVAVGATHNLGEYQSLRIDVAVTLPCPPDEVEQCYTRASEFAAEKLAHEQDLWGVKL